MLKRLPIRCAGMCAGVLLACAADAQEEPVTVRVLPQPLATNREPFRIGLQMGFPSGPSNLLSAECLAGRPVAGDTNVAVEALRDLNTGEPVFRVTNASGQAGGIAVESEALRKGVAYTVRFRCRALKGPTQLRFRFARAGDRGDGAEEKTVSAKGAVFTEKALEVRPRKEGAYRCGLRVEAGGVAEFSGLSMKPGDAVENWSGPALEALRAAGVPAVRWPAAEGLADYDWYQGVGPLETRRPPACAADAAGFGTVEFIAFCRQIGAEPVLRVTVPPFGKAGVDVEKTREGVQRAADWVAYCNSPTGQPLARLRARHGRAEPLGVPRWELVTPEGAVFEGVARAYREAMCAAAPGSVLEVGCAEAPLSEVCDRYVSEVLRRLLAAELSERDYYADWYGALSLANAALERLRSGAGTVYWPDPPERVLKAVPGERPALSERGQLVALFNRFPAQVPLATEGAPASSRSPFQAVAAWTQDPKTLVVFVYNSAPEARKVRLDLTALKRSFAFWAADQWAGDLTARRRTASLPVLLKKKVGSALPQVVLIESLPASFTRVVVKE